MRLECAPAPRLSPGASRRPPRALLSPRRLCPVAGGPGGRRSPPGLPRPHARPAAGSGVRAPAVRSPRARISRRPARPGPTRPLPGPARPLPGPCQVPESALPPHRRAEAWEVARFAAGLLGYCSSPDPVPQGTVAVWSAPCPPLPVRRPASRVPGFGQSAREVVCLCPLETCRRRGEGLREEGRAGSGLFICAPGVSRRAGGSSRVTGSSFPNSQVERTLPVVRGL